MVLESDCLPIISRVRRAIILLSVFDMILEDFLKVCKSFHSCFYSHFRRDGNSVAHALAQMNTEDEEQVWMGVCSPQIASYVLMDR